MHSQCKSQIRDGARCCTVHLDMWLEDQGLVRGHGKASEHKSFNLQSGRGSLVLKGRREWGGGGRKEERGGREGWKKAPLAQRMYAVL